MSTTTEIPNQPCAVCPLKLSKHARKVDNTGDLNLFTCFGVKIEGDKVWLCSGCRRNFGRHKTSGGSKTYKVQKEVPAPVQRPVSESKKRKREPAADSEPPNAPKRAAVESQSRGSDSTAPAPTQSTAQSQPTPTPATSLPSLPSIFSVSGVPAVAENPHAGRIYVNPVTGEIVQECSCNNPQAHSLIVSPDRVGSQQLQPGMLGKSQFTPGLLNHGTLAQQTQSALGMPLGMTLPMQSADSQTQAQQQNLLNLATLMSQPSLLSFPFAATQAPLTAASLGLSRMRTVATSPATMLSLSGSQPLIPAGVPPFPLLQSQLLAATAAQNPSTQMLAQLSAMSSLNANANLLTALQTLAAQQQQQTSAQLQQAPQQTLLPGITTTLSQHGHQNGLSSASSVQHPVQQQPQPQPQQLAVPESNNNNSSSSSNSASGDHSQQQQPGQVQTVVSSAPSVSMVTTT